MDETDAFRDARDADVVEVEMYDSDCVVDVPLLVSGLVGVLLPPKTLPPLNRPPVPPFESIGRCMWH